MMASATNRKAEVEPVTVIEKDQLERKAEAAAAALSVDKKPVDAIILFIEKSNFFKFDQIYKKY